jgi:hypothetical protein
MACRNDCRFIFPSEHGVEHFCDAGVFRHEMANGTGEIRLRTKAQIQRVTSSVLICAMLTFYLRPAKVSLI